MKIPVNKLQEIVAAWIDDVIMPKSSPTQKMIITFALLQKGPEITQMLSPLADADGMIDSDNLIKAFEKGGSSITIPVINWVFDRADLDKLIEKAQAYGNA